MLTKEDKIEIRDMIKDIVNDTLKNVLKQESFDAKLSVDVERQLIRLEKRRIIDIMYDSKEDPDDIKEKENEFNALPTIFADKNIQYCLDSFDFDECVEASFTLGYKYRDETITQEILIENAIEALRDCESVDGCNRQQNGRIVACKFFDKDEDEYWYSLSFIIEHVESDVGD